ncbi:MAG: translation initiation factor IF-6 [Methanomicrobiaceae archaeon]|uniref:Eukaryotic translation initiation factor 6 n=1 Tax=hydrocarbon metagenome TaxID=938273 RepID=A0A0W8FJ49_9ZZZZ|nr:translation initiation factor IF-6 [Methanomicrobiaceae archaeon]MDD5419832.1 translation initiation factor IF-6 [Methanomicrobiaceae archaeon]
MSRTIALAGDPHVGVYSRTFEDIAFVPPGTPQEYCDALREDLGVDLVTTTIQGSAIIGSLLAGNSRGVVVSGLIAGDERTALEDYREVLLLESSMNAAGNVILANDSFAAVHPDMPQEAAEEVGLCLGVPVIRLTLGGIKTVGMAGYATNRGVLVHPRAGEREIALLERVTDLPVGLGSVNMGSGLIGTGLVANSKGYIAGSMTTGFELGRIEEVFGFLE